MPGQVVMQLGCGRHQEVGNVAGASPVTAGNGEVKFRCVPPKMMLPGCSWSDISCSRRKWCQQRRCIPGTGRGGLMSCGSRRTLPAAALEAAAGSAIVTSCIQRTQASRNPRSTAQEPPARRGHAAPLRPPPATPAPSSTRKPQTSQTAPKASATRLPAAPGHRARRKGRHVINAIADAPANPAQRCMSSRNNSATASRPCRP